jgi:hypothetical protein
MPIFMGNPTVSGESITIVWDASFDLQGGPLTYTFKLGLDPNFESIIYQESFVDAYQVEFDLVEDGTYYYTVIITDENGNTMVPFDTLRMDGNTYEGTIKWDYSGN